MPLDINNTDSLSTSLFDYELPHHRIATHPLEPRDESKLLVVNKLESTFSHTQFKYLSDFLPTNTLLIRNNTKVIHARLPMHKTSGGKIEVFLIEPISPTDYQLSLTSTYETTWKVLIRGNVKTGSVILADNLEAHIIEKSHHQTLARFVWKTGELFCDIINRTGLVPLPPYIKRQTSGQDTHDYQTIYAAVSGAVAAPTAGLHFTKYVLDTLSSNHIKTYDITLHVGLGTFKPISTETVEHHVMHAERVSISTSLLRLMIKSLEEQKNIVAVGTTVVRTLESCYWVSVKSMATNSLCNELFQQDHLQLAKHSISPIDALRNLLTRLGTQHEFTFSTSLMISPPYTFRMIKGMITNFHQPKSTLLVLVAAFLGYERWRSVYDEALKKDYRFLSYGDTSLLLDIT